MKNSRFVAPLFAAGLALAQAPSPATEQATQQWWEFVLAWWFVLPILGLVLLVWFVSISTSPERDPDRKPK